MKRPKPLPVSSTGRSGSQLSTKLNLVFGSVVVIVLILIILDLLGCTTSPKVKMKNCTKVAEDYYECDEIPQKIPHEPKSTF